MGIFFTSDLHLGHCREFIYKERGFATIQDMNDSIAHRWNWNIGPDDDVYVLGDLVLGDTEAGCKYLSELRGNIHIVRGNHDTDARMRAYANLPNVVEMVDAKYLKYKGYNFYLSHYPTITHNFDECLERTLKNSIINLYGHTHQKTNFFGSYLCMYHVGVDSHFCTPIGIEPIISQLIENRYETC